MKRPEAADGYELQPCRGLEGTCPFALVKDPALAQRIDLAVRDSGWWPRFNVDSGKARPHHARFRVALAACPTRRWGACSRGSGTWTGNSAAGWPNMRILSAKQNKC